MNALLLRLRSMGRKVGFHRVLYKYRALASSRYEETLYHALKGTILPGDIIWDVGANVGVYTELFCEWTGPTGRVIAFEPNPAPMAKIKDRLKDCSWLTLENVALGPRCEPSTLIVERDDYTVSGHVHFDSEAERSGRLSVPIQILTGDAVCERLGTVPNVIKIDVEGYEEEVLAGLDRTLSSPTVRALFIEIHFRELEARGQIKAPIRIERLLKSKGFKLKWPDLNHLVALRS